MNHLIVYAHPSFDSFSNEIMSIVKEFSTEKEYKTEIRDLYSIGFDPVLKTSDLKGIHSDQIPEDIKREQNYIEWADVITFIYPVWWSGMPAILKGYIDKVFSYSMAYKRGNSDPEGLLKEKIVFLFSPMGTSNEAYGKNGMLDSMKQTCDEGIFKFCGMKVVKHVFFGEATSVEEEVKKEYLKAIPLVLSKGFSLSKCDEKGKSNKDSKNDESNKDTKGNEENKNNKDSKESNKENNKNKSTDYNKDSLSSKNNNFGSNKSKDREDNGNNNKKGNDKSSNKDESDKDKSGSN